MENKNTIKELVTLMQESGENPHFIIGWMMSMIDQAATDKKHSMQFSIDCGLSLYRDKAFKKSRVEMNQVAA